MLDEWYGARPERFIPMQLPWLPDAELGLDYIDTDLPAAPGRDAGLVLSFRLGF